jgi:Zn finger protein HypA/HybF involved in hydrogenase expression
MGKDIFEGYPPAFKLKHNQVVVVCHECDAVINPKTTNGICPWCETELLGSDIKQVKLVIYK